MTTDALASSSSPSRTAGLLLHVGSGTTTSRSRLMAGASALVLSADYRSPRTPPAGRHRRRSRGPRRTTSAPWPWLLRLSLVPWRVLGVV
jgi:hypothetical protein